MIGKTNAISGVSSPVPRIKTVSGSVISISDALALPAESLVVGIEPIQSGSGDPSPSNIRPISGWSNVNVYREAQYDAGATPYATISLNGTRYGGSLDVTTGVLTVTKGCYTITGSEAWNTNAGNTNRYYTTAYILRGIAKLPTDNFSSVPIQTSIGNFDDSYNSMQYTNGKMCIAADGRIGINADLYDLYGGTEVLKDVQICYELATPQTVQLTPTQVQMLLGNNTLWADSGDSELQYWARR